MMILFSIFQLHRPSQPNRRRGENPSLMEQPEQQQTCGGLVAAVVEHADRFIVPVQRHRSVNMHFVKRSMKTARLSRSFWKFFKVFISRKLPFAFYPCR
jgi:preprotein translocase subunit YajC